MHFFIALLVTLLLSSQYLFFVSATIESTAAIISPDKDVTINAFHSRVFSPSIRSQVRDQLQRVVPFATACLLVERYDPVLAAEQKAVASASSTTSIMMTTGSNSSSGTPTTASSPAASPSTTTIEANQTATTSNTTAASSATSTEGATTTTNSSNNNVSSTGNSTNETTTMLSSSSTTTTASSITSSSTTTTTTNTEIQTSSTTTTTTIPTTLPPTEISNYGWTIEENVINSFAAAGSDGIIRFDAVSIVSCNQDITQLRVRACPTSHAAQTSGCAVNETEYWKLTRCSNVVINVTLKPDPVWLNMKILPEISSLATEFVVQQPTPTTTSSSSSSPKFSNPFLDKLVQKPQQESCIATGGKRIPSFVAVLLSSCGIPVVPSSHFLKNHNNQENKESLLLHHSVDLGINPKVQVEGVGIVGKTTEIVSTSSCTQISQGLVPNGVACVVFSEVSYAMTKSSTSMNFFLNSTTRAIAMQHVPVVGRIANRNVEIVPVDTKVILLSEKQLEIAKPILFGSQYLQYSSTSSSSSSSSSTTNNNNNNNNGGGDSFNQKQFATFAPGSIIHDKYNYFNGSAFVGTAISSTTTTTTTTTTTPTPPQQISPTSINSNNNNNNNNNQKLSPEQILLQKEQQIINNHIQITQQQDGTLLPWIHSSDYFTSSEIEKMTLNQRINPNSVRVPMKRIQEGFVVVCAVFNVSAFSAIAPAVVSETFSSGIFSSLYSSSTSFSFSSSNSFVLEPQKGGDAYPATTVRKSLRPDDSRMRLGANKTFWLNPAYAKIESPRGMLYALEHENYRFKPGRVFASVERNNNSRTWQQFFVPIVIGGVRGIASEIDELTLIRPVQELLLNGYGFYSSFGGGSSSASNQQQQQETTTSPDSSSPTTTTISNINNNNNNNMNINDLLTGSGSSSSSSTGTNIELPLTIEGAPLHFSVTLRRIGSLAFWIDPEIAFLSATIQTIDCTLDQGLPLDYALSFLQLKIGDEKLTQYLWGSLVGGGAIIIGVWFVCLFITKIVISRMLPFFFRNGFCWFSICEKIAARRKNTFSLFDTEYWNAKIFPHVPLLVLTALYPSMVFSSFSLVRHLKSSADFAAWFFAAILFPISFPMMLFFVGERLCPHYDKSKLTVESIYSKPWWVRLIAPLGSYDVRHSDSVKWRITFEDYQGILRRYSLLVFLRWYLCCALVGIPLPCRWRFIVPFVLVFIHCTVVIAYGIYNRAYQNMAAILFSMSVMLGCALLLWSDMDRNTSRLLNMVVFVTAVIALLRVCLRLLYYYYSHYVDLGVARGSLDEGFLLIDEMDDVEISEREAKKRRKRDRQRRRKLMLSESFSSDAGRFDRNKNNRNNNNNVDDDLLFRGGEYDDEDDDDDDDIDIDIDLSNLPDDLSTSDDDDSEGSGDSDNNRDDLGLRIIEVDAPTDIMPTKKVYYRGRTQAEGVRTRSIEDSRIYLKEDDDEAERYYHLERKQQQQQQQQQFSDGKKKTFAFSQTSPKGLLVTENEDFDNTDFPLNDENNEENDDNYYSPLRRSSGSGDTNGIASFSSFTTSSSSKNKNNNVRNAAYIHSSYAGVDYETEAHRNGTDISTRKELSEARSRAVEHRISELKHAAAAAAAASSSSSSSKKKNKSRDQGVNTHNSNNINNNKKSNIEREAELEFQVHDAIENEMYRHSRAMPPPGSLVYSVGAKHRNLDVKAANLQDNYRLREEDPLLRRKQKLFEDKKKKGDDLQNVKTMRAEEVEFILDNKAAEMHEREKRRRKELEQQDKFGLAKYEGYSVRKPKLSSQFRSLFAQQQAAEFMPGASSKGFTAEEMSSL